MRIFGKTAKREYILTATENEVEQLAGKTMSDPYGGGIPIGTTFNVTSAIQQVYRNDRRKEQVETIRKSLEAAITCLDMAVPFLEEPKVPEEEKAEEK